MKRIILKHLALVFSSSLLTVLAQAQIPVELTRSFWTDPVFIERFMGSYGVIAESEPKIEQSEIEFFRELQNLIPTSPAQALSRINSEIKPDSSAALYFIRANLNFQQGKLSQAASDYESALRDFPEFRRAHKNLGLIRLQQSDFAGAVAALSNAVELGDGDSRTFGLMGYCYFNLEKYIASKSCYLQSIALDPDNRDWKVGLARSLAAMEEYKSALSLVKELVTDSPEDLQLWLFLVNLNLNLDQTKNAASLIEVLRLRGQADEQTLFLLGNIYVNQEDFGLALEIYQELLAQIDVPERAGQIIQIANVMVRYGAFNEAQGLLDALTENIDGSIGGTQLVEVLELRAELARAEGNMELTSELWSQILEMDALNGRIIIQLADYRYENGEIESALLLLERAERVEEYRAQAMRARGRIFVKERKYSEAVDALEVAYNLNPDDTRLRDYLSEVRRAAQIQDR